MLSVDKSKQCRWSKSTDIDIMTCLCHTSEFYKETVEDDMCNLCNEYYYDTEDYFLAEMDNISERMEL